MATPLDLQEQEQLDQLKHFWKQYASLITWLVIIALAAFAAFNGWQWLQRDRAAKAGALYDQLDQAVQAGDVDKSARVFADIKERHGSTAFAEQAGMLTAKLQFEKGQLDAARASLEWVAANATEKEYQWLARLRLAGILLDQKKYDEALEALPTEADKAFVALAFDRRGDILLAQGKVEEAKTAYRSAWESIDPVLDYRRLVDAKLTSLGAAPAAPAEPGPAASAAAEGASK